MIDQKEMRQRARGIQDAAGSELLGIVEQFPDWPGY